MAEAVSLAHVGRPLTLARWARSAGYEVHFACGPAYAKLVRAEGFEPIELATIAPKDFYGRLAKGSFFYTEAELEDYVRAELKLFDELRPALVVGDFRLSLGISCELTHTPLLSLINGYWSPNSAARFPAPKVGLLRFLPGAVREKVFALIRPLALRFFARPLDQVRRRFGLEPCADFRRHYTAGNWCAYLDLPELVPVKTLPKGHFFLGPVQWQPSRLGIGDCRLGIETNSNPQSPIVYVSLGSSGDCRALPNILRALAELNCDAVVSGVANQSPISNPQSPIVLAAPLFDPHEVLQRAVLTVCHGGSGTIYQSLAAGVPVLSLPGNPDQALAASAAAAQGAALIATPNSSVKTLSGVLSTLLNEPSFRQQALRLSRLLRQHNTRNHWLDFLKRTVPEPVAAVPQAPRLHTVANGN